MAATVTVAQGAPLGRLGPGFVGFSFEKSHLSDGFFSPDHAALVAMFRLLGPGVVRIGANDVDRSVWQPAAGLVAGGATSTEIGTLAVDALAEFLAATGWRAIYGVNLKTSTPEAAAAEAAYVAARLGASLAAIEIGNEIDLYDGGYARIVDRWRTFAAAIGAAVPGAALAGPGAASDASFASAFARDEGAALALLTQHYYRGSALGGGASCARLLATDPAVAVQTRALADAARAAGIRDGFRFTELNSYSSHGAAGVSDAFAAALWGIDFMLAVAELGAAGVNFHGGGQSMDGNVCPSGVDSCTRPFRYSPIIEVDGRVAAAAPLFHGLLFVSQMASGDLLPVTVAAGRGLDFSAHAVRGADGSTVVSLINEDAASAVGATVDLGVPVAAASAVRLEAPALGATTDVTLAGAPVTAAGTWDPRPAEALPVDGTSVAVVVPPASALIVRAR